MPSGEIHYASNAPAIRFKTSAAPSDARRVRHWLAVSRLERQSALAASAGGQARNLRRPAFTPPDRLRPIYDGRIAEVQVARLETLKPAPPPEPGPFKKLLQIMSGYLFKYMSNGYVSGSAMFLATKGKEVIEYSYDKISQQDPATQAFVYGEIGSALPDSRLFRPAKNIAKKISAQKGVQAASGVITQLTGYGVNTGVQAFASYCLGGAPALLSSIFLR